MAGDWIKMRCDLAEDPAVIGIAEATGLSEDHVVGKLHRLWSWASRQLRDGNAPGVTIAWLDRYLSVSGFAQAMINVGWLHSENGGVCIPNFDRHNSQPAKQRALTAMRVETHKKRKGNATSVTKALPEKRREESKYPPKSPQGDFSFSTRSEAEQAVLAAGKVTAAQVAAAADWPDRDFIAACRKAVAENRSRLSRPQQKPAVAGKQIPDDELRRNLVRAKVVAEGRRRGLSHDEIEAAVGKQLELEGIA